MNKHLISRILVHAFLLSLASIAQAAPTNTLQQSDEEHNSPELQKVANASELGIRFDRYTTEDTFGRTITFYLSTTPEISPNNQAARLPLVLFIGGSGCQSAFRQWGDRVSSGLQGLVLSAAQGRARVMIVEKPGVEYLFQPEQPGSAIDGSEGFLREHTLDRWGEANAAAVCAAWTLPEIDKERTLCMGHSEGAIIAARVSAVLSEVTHTAVLSGGGVTQLFSLAQLAMEPREDDEPGDALNRRDAIYAGWRRVLESPDSIKDFWMGHPHRRWSTFLQSSVIHELLQSNAKVFAAQGTADTSEHIDGLGILVAELLAQGRNTTEVRVEGVDHGYRAKDAEPGPPVGFQDVFAKALNWFLKE